MAAVASVKDAETNLRGIPKAPFVDKVEDYVSSRAEVETTLKSFQEMISHQVSVHGAQHPAASGRSEGKSSGHSEDARHREVSQDQEGKSKVSPRFTTLTRRQAGAEPLETTFELNDTLYAKASIPQSDEVFLWLGANVMLSYPLLEAEALLDGKLTTAQSSLASCEEDLDFLREQITTLEVATARVYNWDVQERRKDKSDGKEEACGKESADG